MAENVEAKHPAADRETDQEKNNDRPNKKGYPPFADSRIIRNEKRTRHSARSASEDCPLRLSRHEDLVQERALPAGSNDVPQPQLRALKGFLTRKPAPDKPSS